jgi:iron(III) transport system ATP-binding protein
VISASGVDKTFTVAGKASRILRSVTFEATEGEFLVAIGASGSGKTTLLRTVAGLERPDAGTIRLRGNVVFDARSGVDVAPQGRELGMVFQSYAIWPHLSVLQNVMLPLERGHRRMQHDAARHAAMIALEMVGIAALADRPSPLLSGGQQQRVALARALAVSSDVLLMDEPLSNLDARLREEVRGELKALSNRLGTTVLYVTHDQAEAMSMADRMIVLDGGEVVQSGAPSELYRHPATARLAEFLGRVNWFHGSRAADGRIETPFGLLRAAPVPLAATLTVGIRPEHLVLDRNPPGDAENVARATVASAQFLGSSGIVEVDVAEQRLSIEVRGTDVPARGERVFVRFPAEQLFVFERNPA